MLKICKFLFVFVKLAFVGKFKKNIQISVNMIDRLDIIDEYSVKCDFILNTVTFINAALNISFFFFFFFFFFLKRYKHVMFYDFIYLAKGFRMRPKVRSTLS